MSDVELSIEEWDQIRLCQRCGHGHAAHWPNVAQQRTTACIACLDDQDGTKIVCDRTGYHVMESGFLTVFAARLSQEREQAIDAAHLASQREWSRQTFGPGRRTLGILDHIRKELKEIEDEPLDVGEWVDVVILALDGAWRAGAEPQQIIDAIKAKQARNEARTWPDWRTASDDVAIEHDRTAERDAAPSTPTESE